MSDMDYRDARYGFSESDIAALEAEQAREEKWAEFVDHMAWFIKASPSRMVFHLAHCIANERTIAPEPGSFAEVIMAFKDGQEWSDVLGAFSRAYKRVEQERERLLTQG